MGTEWFGSRERLDKIRPSRDATDTLSNMRYRASVFLARRLPKRPRQGEITSSAFASGGVLVV
jgi:hypothetical protein